MNPHRVCGEGVTLGIETGVSNCMTRIGAKNKIKGSHHGNFIYSEVPAFDHSPHLINESNSYTIHISKQLVVCTQHYYIHSKMTNSWDTWNVNHLIPTKYITYADISKVKKKYKEETKDIFKQIFLKLFCSSRHYDRLI